MEHFSVFMAAYFVIVSLFSVIVCLFDKYRARRGGFRVSEATLWWLSVLGGAAAMLATMKTVRHKTRHKKFMIGLPIIIAIHIIIAVVVILNLDNGLI